MDADAVTLRPARLEDAGAIAAMSRDFIEAGLAWRYRSGRVAELIRDADTMVLVACGPSALNGFAVMRFGDEHAHLSLLCVRPAQRRHGIGRRLLEWLVASARVAGIGSLHLELRADNTAAHAFYRSFGFTETMLVPGYYDGKVAALRMAKLLRRVE